MFNKNHEKVFNYLEEALKHDKVWHEKSDGWRQIETIKQDCFFEKRGTVVGCLQGLKKEGLVKSTSMELIDGTIAKFCRVNY